VIKQVNVVLILLSTIFVLHIYLYLPLSERINWCFNRVFGKRKM